MKQWDIQDDDIIWRSVKARSNVETPEGSLIPFIQCICPPHTRTIESLKYEVHQLKIMYLNKLCGQL